MRTIGIDPSLNQDGQLVALLDKNLAPNDARPVPLPELDGVWNSHLRDYSASTSVVAGLGVAGFAKSTFSANSTTMIWDALAGKLAVDETGALIRSTLWGIGLRTVLTFRTLDSDTELNVAQVAAHAEIKGLEIEYEIRSIGLGPLELAKLLRTVPLFGRFGVDVHAVLKDVKSSLIDTLIEGLTPATRAKLQPAVVTFAGSPAFLDNHEEARAWRFSMKQIAAGVKLADALKSLAKLQQGKAWLTVTKDAVTRIYAQVIAGAGDPTPEDQTAAMKWLQ